ARLVWKMKGGIDWTLDALPSVADPESWTRPEKIAQLILWFFRPWDNWRFDPTTETVAIALEHGEWAFRLKGIPSETEIMNRVERWINTLSGYGFNQVVEWMGVSFNPADYGMDAEKFASALSASSVKFTRINTDMAPKIATYLK